jgi:hypothetical protein
MSDPATKIVTQPKGLVALTALTCVALFALTGCLGPPLMHYDIENSPAGKNPNAKSDTVATVCT